VVVSANERLEGFRLIKTSEFCMVTTSMAVSQGHTELLEILTCIDERISLTVGMPKHAQHLRPEYSPISFNISAHHDNRVSNIGAFHTVVREHRDGIGARGVGTGEGDEALVLVEERRHVRATKDGRAWTIRKWHLIPGFDRSRDGLYE